MKTYRLTLRRTFVARDDIEARLFLREEALIPLQLEKAEKELHEVYENQAPRPVPIHRKVSE